MKGLTIDKCQTFYIYCKYCRKMDEIDEKSEPFLHNKRKEYCGKELGVLRQ